MLLQISEVLTRAECAAIMEALADEAVWTDGKSTAGGAARRVKANLQGNPSSPIVKGVCAKVEKALHAHPAFRAAAQPASIARLLISQYSEGMEYGDHVDAAYMDGVRADLSFTLFLNNPDNYEGGALVIDFAGHTDEFRAPAGSLVLYPSTTAHRVEAVPRGKRIAAVGWVRSKVRSAEARAVLYDLETAIAETAEGPHRLRLSNIRNNLLRLFGD